MPTNDIRTHSLHAPSNKSLDASGGSVNPRQKEKGKGKKKSRRRVNSAVVRLSKCYDLLTHQFGFTERKTVRCLFACEAT
jgi:hypothetical protein